MDYLEKEGWEVYKEVLCPKLRYVADIYAVKRYPTGKIKESLSVETKTQFGVTVMEQADNWKRHATYNYIAVPAPKRRNKAFGVKVCTLLGLGILEVSDKKKVTKILQAKKTAGVIEPRLIEEQKLSQAGSSDRKHWTPFKETAERVYQFAKENPGVPIEDLVDNIIHHYRNKRSASSSIVRHIQSGVIPDMSMQWDKSHNGYVLYSVERKPTT